MKRLFFVSILFLGMNLMMAQNLQLPGTGSNEIQWASTDVNAASQLSFANPEYNVTGFTIKFATSSNANYTAISLTNHFTQDMLANIPLLLSGSTINLDVTLKASGEGHQPWERAYLVHLN